MEDVAISTKEKDQHICWSSSPRFSTHSLMGVFLQPTEETKIMPIFKILPSDSIQEHRQNCKPKMQEMEKDMSVVHEYRCNRRVGYDRHYYETRDFFSSFGKTPQYQKYINFSPFLISAFP